MLFDVNLFSWREPQKSNRTIYHQFRQKMVMRTIKHENSSEQDWTLRSRRKLSCLSIPSPYIPVSKQFKFLISFRSIKQSLLPWRASSVASSARRLSPVPQPQGDWGKSIGSSGQMAAGTLSATDPKLTSHMTHVLPAGMLPSVELSRRS